MTGSPPASSVTGIGQGEVEMRNSPVLIFGQDVSHLPEGCIFMIGCMGIFILYLTYGAVQEYLFKTDGFSEHFIALTAYQFFLYVIISLTESRLTGVRYDNNFRAWLYCAVGVTTTGTILLSNAAVVYLNYPTQVIFKCCKLIPVMTISIVVHRKEYKLIDYIAVTCMIIGLIFFTLTDVSIQPNFNLRGVVAISIALICDGYVGNLQELAMNKYQIPGLQILTYSYAFGFLLLLTFLVLSGSLPAAVSFAFTHPRAIFVWGSLFAFSGYFGLQFVLLLVHHFGALCAVTVTTVRKSVTILFSFIFFTKAFAFGYVWSGALVALGIYLSTYSKIMKSKAAKSQVAVSTKSEMEIV